MTIALVRTRTATLDDDVARVVALHARCSPATLHRRFHVPVPEVHDRLVRRLIAPPGGWSVLAAKLRCGRGAAPPGPAVPSRSPAARRGP